VRPYDADAKRWFTEILTYLVPAHRLHGRRARALDSRSQGIQALVDEFAELSGDYTRRIYYQPRRKRASSDAAGYERLVHAGRPDHRQID